MQSMPLAKPRVFLLLGLVVVFAAAEARAQVSTNHTNTIVRFRILTNTRLVGEMDVELFDQDKPATVANFLNYVTNGAYANSIIHRLVPGFILQGGAVSVSNPYSPRVLDFVPEEFAEVPTNPPIVNEYSVGPELSNVFGTIAMARLPGETNSATASWFFNIANNPHLNTNDGGFTVFGKVKTGASLLNYFNRPSSGLGLFDELPVSFNVFRQPAYRDLFQVQMHVLNPADKVRPLLTLTKPVNGSRVTNEVTLTGTGTDLGGVATIEVLLNERPMQTFPFPPTNRWSLTLGNLPAGTNHLTVQLVDRSGQRSLPLSRYCFNVVPAPFPLVIVGPGTIPGLTNCQVIGSNCVVSTNFSNPMTNVVEGMTNVTYGTTNFVTNCVAILTNCTLLELGRSYSFTAKPPPGYVVYWKHPSFIGQIEDPRISFIMSEDFGTVEYYFVPNPFPALAGAYHGLFHPPNEVAHDQSGYVTITVNASGRFTMRLRVNGQTASVSERITYQGIRSGFVRASRPTRNYFFTFYLDVTNQIPRIHGIVDGLLATNNWTNSFVAERASWHSRTNKAPFAGKYTLALDVPPGTDPVLTPGGNSYATATATTAGLLSMAGVLADNTPFTFSAPVSPSYQWPFHPVLYGGKGSLIGWVNLLTNDFPITNNAVNGLEGKLNWFKPPRSGPIYTNGFSVTNVMLAGSSYPNVATNRLLLQETNQVEFRGGYLTSGWTNRVRVGPNNLVTNDSTNSLVFTLTKPSGLFSGTVKPPGSPGAIPFRGVMLTNANAGYGFFVYSNIVERITNVVGPITNIVGQVTNVVGPVTNVVNRVANLSGQVFLGPPSPAPPPE